MITAEQARLIAFSNDPNPPRKELHYEVVKAANLGKFHTILDTNTKLTEEEYHHLVARGFTVSITTLGDNIYRYGISWKP